MIIITTTNRLKFINQEDWFHCDIIITNDDGILTMVRSRWDETPKVITQDELKTLIYEDRTNFNFSGLSGLGKELVIEALSCTVTYTLQEGDIDPAHPLTDHDRAYMTKASKPKKL